MGVRRSMPSSARARYYKRRLKRLGVLTTVALILAAVVCGSFVYPVIAPGSNLSVGYPSTTTPVNETPIALVREENPIEAQIATPTEPAELTSAISLPTQGQILPPTEDTHILYYTIAGDSLPVVSLRFGVSMSEITSPEPIERAGLLPPGQLLIIPNRLGETSSRSKLLPDSEVTYSPSTIDFDVHGFVAEAGGYLSTYSEFLFTSRMTSGADVISRVALEYSVNPRLLLAFLEYNSGWVYGDPQGTVAEIYPMGHINEGRKGLYRQLAWFASSVMDGYYGWREGRRLVVNFSQGQVLRLAPDLNAGSVGLMHAFSLLYDYEQWAMNLYGDENFFIFYEGMLGSPWIRALEVEPLMPADTVQPEMILPFEKGVTWSFTGGPHPAWSSADVWAALDFAPSSALPGCVESNAWVVASMPGLVVRSEYGVVVIDLDGDGYEQTGWTLVYLHVATKNRIPRGTWVEVGDRIGHPSCEGGRSTGTHIHIARRYNGEWVPADGPLPFVLSGWTARAGTRPYAGWLTRGTDIIYANTSSPRTAHIIREE